VSHQRSTDPFNFFLTLIILIVRKRFQLNKMQCKTFLCISSETNIYVEPKLGISNVFIHLALRTCLQSKSRSFEIAISAFVKAEQNFTVF